MLLITFSGFLVLAEVKYSLSEDIQLGWSYRDGLTPICCRQTIGYTLYLCHLSVSFS